MSLPAASIFLAAIEAFWPSVTFFTKGAPGSPLDFHRKHGRHMTGMCDWVCFPLELAEEFAKRIPGQDEAEKMTQIESWATAVRRLWSDRIVPDGSPFDFWKHRWTETHGGSRPSNAKLRAMKTDQATEEALRDL